MDRRMKNKPDRKKKKREYHDSLHKYKTIIVGSKVIKLRCELPKERTEEEKKFPINNVCVFV